MKNLNVQVEDDVFEKLKQEAELNCRDLHDELVVRLGGVPVPRRPIEEELAEIDAFRASLKVTPLTEELLEQFIQEGRR
ncbi:MAG TPA: hypothetical protein VF665_20810 [Longimicrobium sp.]|jgi:hypothetical protein|uniref:hypothetical protein n=1 Tax=Longimicrobium sp. TaxID=2029185 RepID=UPI002EDAB6A8